MEARGGSIGVESTDALTRFFFVLPASVEDTGLSLTSTLESLNDTKFSTVNEHCLQILFTRFSRYKVYYASQLRLLISEIDTSGSQVLMWRREMEKAVYTCDKDLFESLLLIANTNK